MRDTVSPLRGNASRGPEPAPGRSRSSFPGAALLLISAAVASIAMGEDCIPENKTVNVEFQDTLIDDGIPTSAEMVEDTATAMEADPLDDDEMGAADQTDNGGGSVSFSVPIENKGGHLSGPNGEVQNGFGEGDCIEVYVKVKIRFKKIVCETGAVTVEPGGIGGSFGGSSCKEVWDSMWVRTNQTKQVCPC